MDIPTTEPTEIRAGDTWQWRREDLFSDYPASTWTLKYYLKNASSHIEIIASADGNYFAVTVTAATTIAYAAGNYSWVAYVEKGVERYEINSGTIIVLKSFVDVSAYDNRSHTKKMLDAIELTLEGKAPSDVAQYTIAGRSIGKYSPEELVKFRDYYADKYQIELVKERIKNNKPALNRIKVQL